MCGEESDAMNSFSHNPRIASHTGKSISNKITLQGYTRGATDGRTKKRKLMQGSKTTVHDTNGSKCQHVKSK